VNLGWKLAQVVKRVSPQSLLDSYQAERHPVAARVLKNTMAQSAIRRPDAQTKALADVVSEFLGMEEPRRRMAAEISGLGVRYDLGDGHPLLGRRMPDLDLLTAGGPTPVYSLLRDARPVLINLGQPGGLDIAPRADRVRVADLDQVDLVSYQPGSAIGEIILSVLAEAGAAPRLRFESREYSTARILASVGLAAAIMPRSVAEAPGPAVHLSRLDPEPVWRPSLAWSSARRPTPAVRTFIDFVVNHPAFASLTGGDNPAD